MCAVMEGRQRGRCRTLDIAPAGKVEQVGELVLAHDDLPLLTHAARERAGGLGAGPLCEHLGGPRRDGGQVDGGGLAVGVVGAGDARDRVERGGWREREEVGGALEVGQGIVEARGEGRGPGAVKLADAGECERVAVVCAGVLVAGVLALLVVRLGVEGGGGVDEGGEGVAGLLRVGPCVALSEFCPECGRVQGGVCLLTEVDEALDRGRPLGDSERVRRRGALARPSRRRRDGQGDGRRPARRRGHRSGD